jgi:hypothetical protein
LHPPPAGQIEAEVLHAVDKLRGLRQRTSIEAFKAKLTELDDAHAAIKALAAENAALAQENLVRLRAALRGVPLACVCLDFFIYIGVMGVCVTARARSRPTGPSSLRLARAAATARGQEQPGD